MQPGEKTRAPLRTGDVDQPSESLQLMLTVVFHPDLARIGASMKLGTLDASGTLRLVASVIGRNAPLFNDGLALSESHISRRAMGLKQHPRGLDVSDISTQSHIQVGRDKSSSMSLAHSELSSGVAVRFGHAVVCWLRLVPETGLTPALDAGGFAGVSPEAESVRRLIDVAARCNLPVLLRGESGVGKEVVARLIHRRGARAGERLVSVNMAALPESLIDTALFGVARGAYTGAEKRSGYFVDADEGTLFLDEIGDLPASLQPKLLRALQEGEVQVVGGKSTTVDVRIIAATDAHLDNRVDFKNALLQRLSGITIKIPPLSHRGEDIGLLLLSLDAETAKQSVALNLSAARESHYIAAAWASFCFSALYEAWPGNVRELLLAAQRNALDLDAKRVSRPTAEPTKTIPLKITDRQLVEAHEAANYEVAETARRLGLSRQAIYRRFRHIASVTLMGQLADRDIRQAIADVGKDLDALSRRLKVSRSAIAQRLRSMSAGK